MHNENRLCVVRVARNVFKSSLDGLDKEDPDPEQSLVDG